MMINKKKNKESKKKGFGKDLLTSFFTLTKASKKRENCVTNEC